MGSRSRWVSIILVLGLVLGIGGVGEATAHDSHRRHRDRGVQHDDFRGTPRYYHGRRASRRQRDSTYYCAACRHRFHARRDFHNHLSRRHHIPLWQIPFVVVHGVVHGIVGWIFYG